MAILVAVVVFVTVLGRPESTAAGTVARIDEGFETDQWYRNWSGWTPGALDTAAIAPSVDGSALTVTIPAGAHDGSRFILPLDDAAGIAPDEIYFRYDLRLADNWGGDGTGKLPGPAGLYSQSGRGGRPSTLAEPGWSARIGFGPGPSDGTTRLSYYVYHLDQPGRFGQGFSFGDGGVLRNGEWYCLEGRVRMNAPGSSDGILEAWIDGQQVLSRTDVAFRRDNELEIGVNAFWFNVYFGGSFPAPTTKAVTFDNVAVGPDRIGCGDTVGQVVSGDVTGDGRSDLVTLGECDAGLCWEVEEGDPLHVRPIDQSVVDNRLTWSALRFGLVGGDFDGDGHDDIAYWGRCGAWNGCWTVQRGGSDGLLPAEGWGSHSLLETADRHLGMAAGDVDGDGRSDLIYQAPCDDGTCWYVQRSTGSGFEPPESWGGGSFPGPSTSTYGLMTGDADGDGRHDLIYAGRCGDPAVDCWRVQRSTGTGFTRGETWALQADLNEPIAGYGVSSADVDGDDRVDLVYLSQCELSPCWRALISTGTAFEDRYWGSTDQAEPLADLPALAGDLDGDHDDDVAVPATCDGDRCWKVLLSSRSGFVATDPEDGELVIDVVETLPAAVHRFTGGRTRSSIE